MNKIVTDVYKRIVDVLNEVFGCQYKGYQRGYWKSRKMSRGVWFPQSTRDAKDLYDKKSMGLRKWRNLFRNDDNEVVEYWPTNTKANIQNIAVGDERIVFAKFIKKSDYVFMGVYRFKCFEGTNARVYERVTAELTEEMMEGLEK